MDCLWSKRRCVPKKLVESTDAFHAFFIPQPTFVLLVFHVTSLLGGLTQKPVAQPGKNFRVSKWGRGKRRRQKWHFEDAKVGNRVWGIPLKQHTMGSRERHKLRCWSPGTAVRPKTTKSDFGAYLDFRKLFWEKFSWDTSRSGPPTIPQKTRICACRKFAFTQCGPRNTHANSWPCLCQILVNFQNPFTHTVCRKFAIKWY